MKVYVVTPITVGGPFIGGKELVAQLNKRGHQAKHIHTFPGIISTMLYTDADVVHSMVPYLSIWEPIVMQIRGNFKQEKLLYRLLYPLSLKLANKVTTPTKYLKKELDLNRAEVIPNAVDLDRFKVSVNHREHPVKIVTMTSFKFKDKGEGMINLAQLLKVSKVDAEWHILGDGKYRAEIEPLVRKIYPNVHFDGYIEKPEEELPKYDIFAYYSQHDNFPNAILQAMAVQLPVVSNNFGATAEIIIDSKSGYICSGDYGATVKMLVENWQLRKKIGVAARNRIEQVFSWEVVADKFIKIYEEAMQSG